MIVVNIMGPVILLVALGAALRRGGFADEAFFRGMNKLVFWVGLPCFLFISTAQPLQNLGAAAPMFLALLGVSAAVVAAAYVTGWGLRLPRRSLGAFVQAAFRGNLAYVGVPIVLFAIAAEGGGQAFKDVAFLVIAPLILVYNVTAVLVLVAGAGQAGTPLGRQMRSIVTHTVSNPLLLATAAGLAWAATGWRLPLLVDRTLTGVGQISSPLALIGLGAMLSFASVRGQAVRTAAGALLKTGFGPLAAWLIGTAMGLGPGELRVVLIYAACPTAAAAFVMAEQMGADHLLTNGIVVVSVVLAVPALVVVLLI